MAILLITKRLKINRHHVAIELIKLGHEGVVLDDFWGGFRKNAINGG